MGISLFYLKCKITAEHMFTWSFLEIGEHMFKKITVRLMPITKLEACGTYCAEPCLTASA